MDIGKEIGTPALLGQVAEECAELGKACLKLQRILMGTNPTPVTEAQARNQILEEATDVQDCIWLLLKAGFDVFDKQQSENKMNRWEQRILEAKKTP